LAAAAANSGAVSAELAAAVELLANDPTAHLSLWLLCVDHGVRVRCRWRDALVSEMSAAGLLRAGASDVYANPEDMAVLWGDRGECARAANADSADNADVSSLESVYVQLGGVISPTAHAVTQWVQAVDHTNSTRADPEIRRYVHLAVVDVPSMTRTHDPSCGAFDWLGAEGRRADAALRGVEVGTAGYLTQERWFNMRLVTWRELSSNPLVEAIVRAVYAKGQTAVVGRAGHSILSLFSLQFFSVLSWKRERVRGPGGRRLGGLGGF